MLLLDHPLLSLYGHTFHFTSREDYNLLIYLDVFWYIKEIHPLLMIIFILITCLLSKEKIHIDQRRIVEPIFNLSNLF